MGPLVSARRTAAALVAALLLLAAGPPALRGQANVKPKLPESYKAWLEDEVAVIIAPMEREVFLKLAVRPGAEPVHRSLLEAARSDAGDLGERVQDRASTGVSPMPTAISAATRPARAG